MELNSPQKPVAPVGMSHDRIYGFNGNVQEWVADPADEKGVRRYPSTPVPASRGRMLQAELHVVRGGFQTMSTGCRSAFRECYRSQDRYMRLGFRVVRFPKPIAIKTRVPLHRCTISFSDVYMKHSRVYAPSEAQEALRNLKIFEARLDAAVLLRLFPTPLDESRPRLPCRCSDIKDKFSFNLRYQDTRLKVAVEAHLGNRATREQCDGDAEQLMDAASIMLRTKLSSVGLVADVLTDNDFDAIVYAIVKAI